MIVLNRLLGLLLWLGIAAGAVITAVESGLIIAGEPPWLIDREVWDATLSELVWSAPLGTGIAAGLLVLGVILLVLQIKPRRPRALPAEGDEDRRVAYDRRGLERHFGHVAGSDLDVVDARVKVRRSRAPVRARTYPDAEAREVAERVRADLERAAGEIKLQRRLRFHSKLEASGRRAR